MSFHIQSFLNWVINLAATNYSHRPPKFTLVFYNLSHSHFVNPMSPGFIFPENCSHNPKLHWEGGGILQYHKESILWKILYLNCNLDIIPDVKWSSSSSSYFVSCKYSSVSLDNTEEFSQSTASIMLLIIKKKISHLC